MWDSNDPKGLPRAWQGAAARAATAIFHCLKVIMTQQAEARGGANQRLWTNMMVDANPANEQSAGEKGV